MSLNFCETLFDKGTDELMKTWSVVIKLEFELHRSWILNPTNKLKYKSEFIDYLESY
jgi:hypothetical protein